MRPVHTETTACPAPVPARCWCRRSSDRSSHSGYVYIMVLFLMVMMVTASTTVLMDMRTQGRRQREEDMIWRGREFVRAIKLYYRKTGHYPQNLDDLQKGVANIHFLRQEALTDPMNKDGDGKWRFIYTNAAGQIIGSVHYATMQQMAILDMYGGKIPGLQGSDSGSDQDTSSASSISSTSSSISVSSSSQSDQNQQQPQGDSTSNTNCPQPPLNAPGLASSLPGVEIGASLGANPMGGGQVQSQPLQIGPGPSSSFSSSSQNQAGSGTCPPSNPLAGMQLAALQALMTLKPTGPVGSPVIGGFVVGVGGTVDRKSVRIYKSGKKYNEWEFIWNPIEDQALAVQQGLNQGAVGLATGPLGQPIGLGGQGFGATGGSGPIQAPPTEGPPQPPQIQQQ